ncbi:hypothetical protein G7Y89_g7240 [Cudoniella acicularis]|uniref:USP domain-containing protein n=1 Tax=Cudoniella acicularis TaxID=354080 RepID=A0A8H4RKU8_9HELO|nr:hypothetical protein G7Y89_g7240 [Cudoniella acicularis]
MDDGEQAESLGTGRKYGSPRESHPCNIFKRSIVTSVTSSIRAFLPPAIPLSPITSKCSCDPIAERRYESCIAGWPSPYASSSVNGGGPVSKENMSGIIGSIKGVNRIFPHLDDLVSVQPDVDINSPIRTVLGIGERSSKSAETQLDFHRPDIAMQEYIKASIIAIDVIPRHKDYVLVQSDRGELHRQYMGLTKRINAQHKKFEDVKALIKENNTRSGVKPASAAQTIDDNMKTPQTNGHSRGQSTHMPGVDGNSTNGVQDDLRGDSPSNTTNHVGTSSKPPTPRQKPVIQPKPEALHGKALQPQGNGPQADLMARFARLRSPEPKTAVQDPRIRTQPISIPEASESTTGSPISSENNYATISRPTGPREIPSVPQTAPQQTKLELDVQIPQMPRAPDAIYTPTRNAETAATANLPSSFQRPSSFLPNGRKSSAPPISSVGPTPVPMEPAQDYFSTMYAVKDQSPAQTKKSQPVFIPESVYISAEDVLKYTRLGSQVVKIMLVDLRSRDEFDSGHIMSQSIICVEPIALRRGISGEELEEGMVLAPDHEQALFERRAEYDMVIFYDQSSTLVNPFNSGVGDPRGCLHDFAAAVYDFGYEKRLKRRPMLLVGGLDAWVDLLGQNSLKVTSNSEITTKPAKPVRHLGRVPIARDARKAALARSKVESRLLTKEEENRWDQTLREDQIIGRPADADSSTPDELFYAKTTDDFFRRYPDISTMQESMVSSTRPRSLGSYADELPNTIPRPPARPPPALPRQRSSGITERGPPVVYSAAHSVNNQAITKTPRIPGLTGLNNPKNLCYLNTVLQSISATVFLRELLINHQYPPREQIPAKDDETSDPPQLMVRNLGSVMKHLWSGYYDWISPRTFQEYVQALHLRMGRGGISRAEAFGSFDRQHDASEFAHFLTTIMGDELNPRRNISLRVFNDEQHSDLAKMPVMRAATLDWQRITEAENSPFTHYMSMQSAFVRKCTHCTWKSNQFDTFTRIHLPMVNQQKKITLIQLLQANFGEKVLEKLEGFNCPNKECKIEGGCTEGRYFTRLSEYVAIDLKRFTNDLQKIKTLVTFPENNLDLTEFFYPHSEGAQSQDEYKPPFLYQCYGVMQHAGGSIKGGHFWALTKHLDKPSIPDGPGSWHSYNDTIVTKRDFQETQRSETYSILLRRQKGRI